MAPEEVRPVGTRDTRLIERALRERWPITPEYRKRIVNRALLIALGRDKDGKPTSTSNREILSAIRTLIMADNLNIEAEKEVLPQQHNHLHVGIDLDKISTDELKKIEADLIRLTQEGMGDDLPSNAGSLE